MAYAAENPQAPDVQCSGIDAEGLALLSHELRGALTVIGGYSELLGKGLAPSEQAAALAGIGRAVVRADALLSEALASDRARVGASAVDLLELAQEVASEQRAATQRQIDVVERAHPTVAGDPSPLARAITNLINNAAKYSLSNSSIQITVDETDDRGIVEVADRGPGIPEADRKAVLEPFTRLSRDESAPGSGLGLTVVSRVVEAAGGNVKISDRPGGGAIVRLELPLAH